MKGGNPYKQPYGVRAYDLRCPECGKAYYWNRSLKFHLDHYRDVLISCRGCGAVYKASRGIDNSIIISRKRGGE